VRGAGVPARKDVYKQRGGYGERFPLRYADPATVIVDWICLIARLHTHILYLLRPQYSPLFFTRDYSLRCPSSILSSREYRSVSFSLHYLHRFIAVILDRATEDEARKLVAGERYLPCDCVSSSRMDICRLNK
jgi:hypothetical protein